jgi:hypothetical protein
MIKLASQASSSLSNEQVILLVLVILIFLGDPCLKVVVRGRATIVAFVLAFFRRVWNYILDKLMEAIIVGILSLSGLMWVLEIFSSTPR